MVGLSTGTLGARGTALWFSGTGSLEILLCRQIDVEAKNVGFLQSLSPFSVWFNLLWSRFSALVAVRWWLLQPKTLSHPSIRSRCYNNKKAGKSLMKVSRCLELLRKCQAWRGECNHFYRFLTIKPSIKTAKWVVRRWLTLIISGSIVKCKRIDSYQWCRSISDAFQCRRQIDLA